MLEEKLFVNIWAEKVILPTYEIGEADSLPHFLEKRIYQGASGAVYPYRVVEHIKDDITDKEYEAIYLENPYVKIMVLPELGGRVHMAWDKIAKRHFVYYNHVVKPALVGLTGPWISGGIEFNWPQHHRPSTYLPVKWNIVTNCNGSKTLWVGEIERMYGLTGMAGFTLYPDAALLEIKGRIYNGTNTPRTFLWWANPAVKAGDGHQSIFPPDVTAVFDHGKRDVSSFPIATGEYYKVDYSAGVDISRYKNIPVPTSYMAWKSEYNFVGAYDHADQGGLLHIADYQIAPGKKQWTWGNGEFGKAWDCNLTDNDGPYIELMTGVFTDNQPDFAWIDPYEEKSFTQIFMPYSQLGEVSNANRDIVLRCDIQDNQLKVQIYATKEVTDWTIQLVTDKKMIEEKQFSASPSDIWADNFTLKGDVLPQDVKVIIKDSSNHTSLQWAPHLDAETPLPDIAKAPLPPQQVEHTEELWLIGMHIYQYHHGTANAMDYWQEAIRRDVLDYRCNLAIARHYMMQDKYKKALKHLKNAKTRATMLNGHPYDGEVFFLLGLVFEELNEYKKAYDSYYKAVWNSAWADKAYFALAYLEVQNGNYIKAQEFIVQSIERNGLNEKANHLYIVILRLCGQTEKAIVKAKQHMHVHPFAMGAIYELYLLTENNYYLQKLYEMINQDAHYYIELSLDYLRIKDYQHAYKIVKICGDKQDPLLYYYRSYYLHQLNDTVQSNIALEKGNYIVTPQYFPNRNKDICVLKYIMQKGSTQAALLLGDYYYAKKRYKKAIKLWQWVIKNQSNNAVAYRNLAIATYNKQKDTKIAIEYMENAVRLDANNSRLLLELDQLYQVTKKSPQERLKFFEEHIENIQKRDDLYIEYIKLLNLSGQYAQALDCLEKHQFHPWEGGEGRVSAQWIISHIMLSQKAYMEKDYQKATNHLKNARDYPKNLGEGKLVGTTDNEILYLLGATALKFGDKEKAKDYFEQATKADVGLSISQYYNDQPADYILFQGLSYLQNGDETIAQQYFDKLFNFAQENMHQKAQYDFFAVSLPNLFVFDQNIQGFHNNYCNMILGLSYIGKKDKTNAMKYLQKALLSNPDNSRIHLIVKLLNNGVLGV